MPVIPTIASQFADAGVDRLWEAISEILNHECGCNFTASEPRLGVDGLPTREPPIPPERQGYLAEVASAVRGYHSRTERVSDSVRLVQRLEASAERLRKSGKITSVGDLEEEASEIRETVPTEAWGPWRGSRLWLRPTDRARLATQSEEGKSQSRLPMRRCLGPRSHVLHFPLPRIGVRG